MPPSQKRDPYTAVRERANVADDAHLFGDRQRPTDQPIKTLCSFHYFRNFDMEQAWKDLTTPEGPPLIMADSGAFSAMTLGTEVSIPAYAAWLKQWMPYLQGGYATLDVIGDAVGTDRNTREIEEVHGLSPIPVVHVGAPMSTVGQLCERYPYVAVGGMVGKKGPELERWIVSTFVEAQRWGTLLHGFGQTRQTMIAKLPWYSVDSSSWGKGHRWGKIAWWNASKSKLEEQLQRQPVPPAAAQQFRAAGVPIEVINGRGDYHWAYMPRASAWGWWQLEVYLRRRHGPIATERAPERTPGLHLYLVDSDPTHLNGMLM